MKNTNKSICLRISWESEQIPRDKMVYNILEYICYCFPSELKGTVEEIEDPIKVYIPHKDEEGMLTHPMQT